jgi:hypothetical protein
MPLSGTSTGAGQPRYGEQTNCREGDETDAHCPTGGGPGQPTAISDLKASIKSKYRDAYQHQSLENGHCAFHTTAYQ